MQIVCPNCETSYQVEPSSVGAERAVGPVRALPDRLVRRQHRRAVRDRRIAPGRDGSIRHRIRRDAGPESWPQPDDGAAAFQPIPRARSRRYRVRARRPPDRNGRFGDVRGGAGGRCGRAADRFAGARPDRARARSRRRPTRGHRDGRGPARRGAARKNRFGWPLAGLPTAHSGTRPDRPGPDRLARRDRAGGSRRPRRSMRRSGSRSICAASLSPTSRPTR